MATRLLGYAVFSFLTAFSVARAEQPIVCFEIIAMPTNPVVSGPMLVNRCSGETWVLVRQPVETNGKETGSFVYMWSPISLALPIQRPR
jgi:hypothetical protein